MKYSFIYISSVFFVNLMFSIVPSFVVFGEMWSVGSILAGMVFVFRDYAQQEVGGFGVLVLMIAACIASYLMADPFVALASGAAFAISELVDYLAFSLSNRSFKFRVLLSSVIGVPVDTFIFLFLIDHVGFIGFLIMCLSKFLALLFLYFRK